MSVLVRLGRHVMSANDTGSFLSMTYGSALVHVKRNYDKLMHAHLKSIQDVRIGKKTKCGILPFVANFEVSVIFFYITCYFIIFILLLFLKYNVSTVLKPNLISLFQIQILFL